jgi:hypothetical protein
VSKITYAGMKVIQTCEVANKIFRLRLSHTFPLVFPRSETAALEDGFPRSAQKL